jgi:hypothetical protein
MRRTRSMLATIMFLRSAAGFVAPGVSRARVGFRHSLTGHGRWAAFSARGATRLAASQSSSAAPSDEGGDDAGGDAAVADDAVDEWARWDWASSGKGAAKAGEGEGGGVENAAADTAARVDGLADADLERAIEVGARAAATFKKTKPNERFLTPSIDRRSHSLNRSHGFIQTNATNAPH